MTSVNCSPRVAFIMQHQQQAAATSASHQLELSAMQVYLDQEMGRQDAHMDSMRSICGQDMEVIVADMKKVRTSRMTCTYSVNMTFPDRTHHCR